MTPFSTLLSTHIHQKNIRTHSLALYCGIDRSNMYKLINGKRNPSSTDIVDKIADYMRLTPSEHEELTDAYWITVMGYDTYYRRKHVYDFITTFSDFYENSASLTYDYSFTLDSPGDSEFLMLSNKLELIHALYGILSMESQKSHGQISLLCQPDADHMMTLLASIARTNPYLRIEHILCINNSDNVTIDKRDYNLYCLKKIIPMYHSSLCEYIPSCYYDQISSHNSPFNILSSMVVTSAYVILFSNELEYGMLFSNPEVIRKFQLVFDDLKKSTSPIVYKCDSIFSQLQFFNSLKLGEHSGVLFQQQACLFPFIPLSFPEKYLSEDLPNRNSFILAVKSYISNLGNRLKNQRVRHIFTEEGVRDFLQSGRIYELPSDLYSPVSYSDRQLMVRNLIHACQNYNYVMLRSDCALASSILCVYATPHNGYLLFPTAVHTPPPTSLCGLIWKSPVFCMLSMTISLLLMRICSTVPMRQLPF